MLVGCSQNVNDGGDNLDILFENNRIYYSTLDNNTIPLNSEAFGVTMISNTNQDGQGVLTFDGDIKYIGDFAFKDCVSLTNITIPKSVSQIGDSAFEGCTNLREMILSEGLSRIGDGAFKNCCGLKKIEMFITSMGKECFVGASGELILKPNEEQRITVICEESFMNSNITNVVIQEGVHVIGSRAFYRCTELKGATLPSSVVTIGAEAFYGCAQLSLVVPKTVANMGQFAFFGKDISFEDISKTIVFQLYKDVRLGFVEANGLDLYAPKPNKVGANMIVGLTIKNNNTIEATYDISPSKISQNVLGNTIICDDLLSVFIPDNVTIIEESAFANAYNIRKVVIGKGVSRIGLDAFWPGLRYEFGGAELYCKSLTPPSIYFYEWQPIPREAEDGTIYYEYDQCAGSFGNAPSKLDIYVPRQAYSTYTQYHDIHNFTKSVCEQQNWYGYVNSIEPYDFE